VFYIFSHIRKEENRKTERNAQMMHNSLMMDLRKNKVKCYIPAALRADFEHAVTVEPLIVPLSLVVPEEM